MVKTKSLESTRKNWEGAIGRAATNYSEGVKNTTGWQEAAAAAEDLWAQRVQEAAAARRREKAINRLSDDDWKRPALEKGAQRIGPGMSASKEKFGRGMGEVLSVLQGINLPPRTASVEENVRNRVTPIATALRTMKETR